MDSINDLLEFIDLPEPELQQVRSRLKQTPQFRPRTAQDHIALMKLSTDRSANNLNERMQEIQASLEQDVQNIVHYKLPSELVLSDV
jgi:hypothetical protein